MPTGNGNIYVRGHRTFKIIKKAILRFFTECLILDFSEHYALNHIEKFILFPELQHSTSISVCATSFKGTSFKSSFMKKAFLHLAHTLTFLLLM